MNAKDFKDLLEQTDDKLSIFANPEIKYELSVSEFLDLISEFLSDEEKIRLFDFSRFRNYDNWIKNAIIGLVTDEQIILQMMKNDSIMNGFKSYQIADIIIRKMSDKGKIQLLYDQGFMKKHGIESFRLKDIIASLTEEARIEILLDANFITNELHLGSYEVKGLIAGLSRDEDKDKLIDAYQSVIPRVKIDVLKTCSNDHKIEVLLRESNFKKFDIIGILSTLDTKTLSEFLIAHKNFLRANEIFPYEIVYSLDTERQQQIVANLENLGLNLNEKRQILATLNTETKQSLDATNFPAEYKSALSMKRKKYITNITLDLERDLEDYRGLDNLISAYPEEFTEEQRAQFMKLCNICPNIKIFSKMGKDGGITFEQNVKEYKEAEEWIDSIINNLNPQYSKAQKMAVIDNAIGKKISYTPDFATEVFNSTDCRSLWRIISSGYGVCNGIAKVEQYMLNRIGIESEMIGSGTHAFLKIIDIELPLANGEIVRGNTILDPTWNLTNHRFGGKPENFCISYEEARKHDIDQKGKDHKCHENDEELQDTTLNLDEQSLRRLFTSVGLADSDGKFPIKDLLGMSELLDECYAREPEQNINKQFLLLRQICPEFATCQNSSMKILSDVLLNNSNLTFNKCVVNRVYDKTDKEKRPIIYVFIN